MAPASPATAPKLYTTSPTTTTGGSLKTLEAEGELFGTAVIPCRARRSNSVMRYSYLRSATQPLSASDMASSTLRRRYSRQRERVGPMLPTGISKSFERSL